MPRKPLSYAKEVEKAAALLQKLVRMEAADDDGYCKCVTCGVVRQWNDQFQGGHFISRTMLWWKLEKVNISAQCAACNGPLRGNLIQYTRYMQSVHGDEFVQQMYDERRRGKRYTKAEVIDLQEQFKQEIIEQEKRLGIRSY